MIIGLISFNKPQDFIWHLGVNYESNDSPNFLADLLQDHVLEASAWLLWDFRLGFPDIDTVRQLFELSHINVWHAGLKLNLGTQPTTLNYCDPIALLNCNADSSIESSSWRLTLRACLIRSSVIQDLGGPSPDFESLKACGLELGHRYMFSGVIIRHTPKLIKPVVDYKDYSISLVDELRFLFSRYGRKQTMWSIFRAGLTRYASPYSLWKAYSRAKHNENFSNKKYEPTQRNLKTVSIQSPNSYRVTVLVPTLDRYSYLRTLLRQLCNQTVPAFEIIIVDQTEVEFRDRNIIGEFPDLPIKLIHLKEKGQCLARNVGISESSGDYILFLDDDVEIEPDLIELHLRNLNYFSAGASSGAVNEKGALPLGKVFSLTRISNVLPTGNTLIRKQILKKSGLFDMAYQRKQSEDGDLSIRLQLSGTLMIYNPQIVVFHHRAPQGGLREHGVRRITYASSRTKLFDRNFPHASQIYLAKRYFTRKQINEMYWRVIAGTFSIRGGPLRKLGKFFYAAIVLPHSILKLYKASKVANDLLKEFPQISQLESVE